MANKALAGSGDSMMLRRWGYASVVVDTVLADCEPVDIRNYGSIAVKPGAGITTLTIYASGTIDGTYVLVTDLGTAGAVTVTASRWQSLAVGIAAMGFIKMQSNADGTVEVCGKS